MIRMSRWIAKKLARQGVAAASWASGSLAWRHVGQTPRVRVLTYHRFAKLVRDPFAVAPHAFEEQVAWLARKGLAISLDQLRRFVAGELALPRNAVLITIDDGYVSTFSESLPILRHYDVPAVAFVTAGLIGMPIPPEGEPERHMSWDELAKVAESGVTIGSHGYSHRSLGRLTEEEVREEGARSRSLLEDRTGQVVDSFAYPFGTRNDFNAMTQRALSETGYRTLFTSQHGAIQPGSALLSLPRIKVEGGEGLTTFKWVIRGGLDAWQLVDHTLWRLQRVRQELNSPAA